MKFKEGAIKTGMVIHCPKEEDAKALYEHCDKTYYPNTWDTHKSDTCYHLCGVKTIQSIGYGDDDYYRTRGFSITEFSDLIEPDDYDIDITDGKIRYGGNLSQLNSLPDGYPIPLENERLI